MVVNHFKLQWLSVILSIFISNSLLTKCKENQEVKATDKDEIIVESSHAYDTIYKEVNNIKSNHKPTVKQEAVYKYVNATSGLNFRDAPNGAVIGKFSLNSNVAIMEKTGVYDTIQDAGKKIAGEWLKVRTRKRPVFVFDAYLSESYTAQERPSSDQKIFRMMTYGNNEIYPFVSLGDARMGSYLDKDAKQLLINLKKGKEWETLNKKDRRDYLNFLKIKETEVIYVYDYLRNQHYSFNVNELPLIAVASPYDSTDYFIGFDFKNKIACDKVCHQSLVAIGKESPFSNKGVTPILWEPISTKEIEKPIINYNYFYIDDYELNEARVFYLGRYEYQYLNVSFKDEELKQSFIIIRKQNGDIKRQFHLSSSEGHSPTAFINKSEKLFDHQEQFAGQLLKNKPQAYFGFFYQHYDCDEIEFVETSIPSIRISCDNRH